MPDLEDILKPPHHGGTAHAGGFMNEIKNHKVEVIIGGAGLLVAILMYERSKSGSTAPSSTAAPSAAGLTTTPTTSSGGTSSAPGVTTDQLAAALSAAQQQNQQDLAAAQQSNQHALQSLADQFNQSFSSLTSASSGASGGGSGLTSPPVQTNVGPPTVPNQNTPIFTAPSTSAGPSASSVPSNPALAARNKIGDNVIISFFSSFSLPSWIGLQYVAENYALPWQPGTTPTQAQTTAFNNWLDSHGYRNASTGAFTSVVSSGTVPSAVQSQLNAAYSKA